MGKPYRECPHCGAHLDAGERCDCGNLNNRNRPRRKNDRECG